MFDLFKPTIWLLTLIISLHTKGGSLSIAESQTSQVNTINKQTKKHFPNGNFIQYRGNVPELIGTDEKKYNYQCNQKTISTVLKELGILTSQTFIFSESDLRGTMPVTLNLFNASLKQILDSLCYNQPIYYEFKFDIFYIKHRDLPAKTLKSDSSNYKIINGKIIDTTGQPIPRATIAISKKECLISDDKGEFSMKIDRLVKSLTITSVGFQDQVVYPVANPIIVILKAAIRSVDSFVVVANHKVINKNDPEKPDHLSPQIIGQQPVKDIALISSGLAPGVFIKQSNGSPGSISRIQIRNNSWVGPANTVNFISQNEPLIILDHIPLLTMLINQMPFIGGNPGATGSAVGGFSILSRLSSLTTSRSFLKISSLMLRESIRSDSSQIICSR